MAINPLQVGKKAKAVMGQYMEEARNAKENGKLVAWCTGLAPMEFIWAAGMIPVFPENHAAACGAHRLVPEMSDVAEAAGFSRDVCSYARSNIGYILSESNAGPGALPKPDLLFSTTNTCTTVAKWYEELARHFNVPLFVLDIPHNFHEPTTHMVEYVVGQFRELMDCLSQLTGRPFDWDNFMRVLDLSNQACKGWNEALDLAKNRPSPITNSDLLITMGPIVCLRGTEAAVEFYQALLAEIKQRVADGVAAVPGEQIRLYWDNICIWYLLRNLTEKLQTLGAVVLPATYASSWGFNLDPARPLESLADAYISIYVNRNLDYKIDYVLNRVKSYESDGLLIHSNRSCKPDTLGIYDLRDKAAERLGLPSLILEADHTDYRSFSEAQSFTRIEAFIEMINAKKQVHS